MSQDRKDLKITALLERITTDKGKYEDEIANLRVELTLMSNQVQELSERLNAENQDEAFEQSSE